MKKFIALILALAMILSLGVVAFAAEGDSETTTKGKITISNAEIGKKYVIYKVFDATYATVDDTKAVSYTCSNEALVAAIQAEDSDAPFKTVGDQNPDGSWTIEHIDATSDEAIAAGRGWLKAHIDLLGSATAEHVCSTTDGNTVVFDNLDFGYYLMQPGDGTLASVNTAAPDVTIIDKNPSAPSNPTKVADDHLVAVGDTVTYTVTVDTTNFNTTRNDNDYVGQTSQITEYKVVDTFEGQTFGAIKSVVVSYDGGSKTLTKDEDYTVEFTADATKGSGTATYKFPWVNAAGKSIYPSPAKITIVYTTVMNEHALDNGKFYETNTIDADYKVNETYKDIPGNPSEKVWTTGISIKKVDEASGDLEDAKFVLFKTENGTKKYYKWNTTTKKATWVTGIANADILTADNDYDTCEFKGIDEGTYSLEEVEAPDGYKKPAEPFTVVITGEEVTDENGKVTDVTITGTILAPGAEEPSAANPAEGNRYITTTIVNTKGTSLPSTGGAGTVALIAIGAAVFVIAAVILVTKKRLYNEG